MRQGVFDGDNAGCQRRIVEAQAAVIGEAKRQLGTMRVAGLKRETGRAAIDPHAVHTAGELPLIGEVGERTI